MKEPAHGSLSDPATGALLTNGSLLATPSAWPYAQALAVDYTGAAHYFNAPNVRFNGSFLAFDGGAGDAPHDDDVKASPHARTNARLRPLGRARLI